MGTLKVKQIKAKLKSLFEPHLDLSDIPQSDAGREDKVLSRCLAAYAIYMLTDCSEKDAAIAVWDGAEDNGIDAAYYFAADSRIVIVQSKWKHAGDGEPTAAEVASFANGVRDIIEQNISNFASRLLPRLQEVGQAIMNPGTAVEIILASTGSSTLAQHATANLDRVLAELNGTDDQNPIASKKVLGLNEVYNSLASNSASNKITVSANLLDWSYISTPYNAYFGTIDGLQLKGWWIEHGKRLVSENIRHSLGATDVNDGIRDTATNAPENFWYFNNGITLIADSRQRAPQAAASRSSGNFEFKGASIVNGAQTVSTLARISYDESLGKVRVPIRIIILEGTPENFGRSVTRTNNLQNRVEGRDFVAHDNEQIRIQKEMSMEGVEYQFLRSDSSIPTENACELIEVTTALACAAGDPNLAVHVKTGIGRFFADLKKAPYKTLFNPSLTGARAFNATLIQREIDKWVERKRNTLSKKSGVSWGVLVHGNRILAAGVFKIIGGQALNVPIDEFRRTISSLNVYETCERVHANMAKVLDEKYPGKFLAVLFKSPVMSKDVFERSTVLKTSPPASS